MKFVHIERLNPLNKKPFPSDSPQGHLYANPLAIARIQGHDDRHSLLFWVSDDDPDIVVGFAPDLARELSDATLDTEITLSLDNIDKGTDEIVRAIESIDLGR